MGASAKTLDWINLATCMGSIYGLRAMAITARRKGRARPVEVTMPTAEEARAAAAAAPAAPADDTVDWSLMTGRPNGGDGRPN